MSRRSINESLVCFLIALFAIAQATARDVTIGLNFTGSNRAESGFRPPDTMGTVGHNHIVEMINGSYRLYDKSTGAIIINQTLNDFWSDAGSPHSGNFAFDPRVQYDPQTNRYFATSVDNAAGPNNVLIAVSNSDDPTDGWSGFSIDADTDDQQWADFPQMGFSNDSLVVSSNMFSLGGAGFEINVLTIPKADLVAPVPTIANATLLEDQYSTGAGFNFALQPAIDLAGSGRPLRLFSNSAADDEVEVLQINDPLGTPSLTTLAPVTGLVGYGGPPLANQPGPKVDLQSGGNRTRSAVTLIDDHYYGISGVGVDGRAALRWYKIDADALTLVEEGVIADPDRDFIYGSIAANDTGDIVIGFTASSETEFASAYAAVGETDASGVITFDEPILLRAGVSDYESLDSSGRNRWGDYSATVLDPSDPLTFWTFQEYVSATDQWEITVTEINLSVSLDFDNDDELGCGDVDALVAEIVANTNFSTFDLTSDGLVDLDDLAVWLADAGTANVGGGYLEGDADLNGVVDGNDFLIWNDNKFSATPGGAQAILTPADLLTVTTSCFGTPTSFSPPIYKLSLNLWLGCSFCWLDLPSVVSDSLRRADQSF